MDVSLANSNCKLFLWYVTILSKFLMDLGF